MFVVFFFFFFNDTATTEIYTLSLHDALPISAILIVGFACFSTSASAATPTADAEVEKQAKPTIKIAVTNPRKPARDTILPLLSCACQLAIH